MLNVAPPPRFVRVAAVVVCLLWIVYGVALIVEPSVAPSPWMLMLGLSQVLFAVEQLRRPGRIELRRDELVVKQVRTRRIPYADITAVRGDIPNHPTWSGAVVLERRSGAPVTLPSVTMPLAEVHDLVVERAGLDDAPWAGGAACAAPASRNRPRGGRSSAHSAP